MAVGFAVRIPGFMAMLVVDIMNMTVRVFQRIVPMLMGVPLGEMQIEAASH
jgi:hypothetical protein